MTVAAKAAGVSTWVLVNQASVPFLGVPLVVVSMAATGALISFGIGTPVRDRMQMFRMALVNTLLAAVLVALIPAFAEWTWVTDKLQPPFALAIALALRFLVPIAIDLAPAAARGALKRFFGIEAASPNQEVSP